MYKKESIEKEKAYVIDITRENSQSNEYLRKKYTSMWK